MGIATTLGHVVGMNKTATPSPMASKRKYLHLTLLTFLMAGHTIVHYVILIPRVGEFVEHLPFFDLHVLHEAEYLVVIAYASYIFRVPGGVVALIATALASVPFLFASRINSLEYVEYGFAGPKNNTIDVVVLLGIGAFIVALNEMRARERDRSLRLMLTVEESNRRLGTQAEELEKLSQRLEASNRQLAGLNQLMQSRLNKVFDELGSAVEEQERQLNTLPAVPLKDRFSQFVRQVASVVRQQ